jgi:sarcosine oxidase subunit gamma
MTQKERGKMSEYDLHYPLENIISAFNSNNSEQKRAFIRIENGINFFLIRASNDEETCGYAKEILNQSLPLKFNTFNSGMHEIYWLRPNEWLVATKENIKSMSAKIDQNIDIHIIDQTGGFAQMRLEGENSRDILEKGCPLDIRSKALNPGMCAQTNLAKSNVILAQLDDSPSYNIIVRRSFANYMVEWILNAGKEYTIDLVF